MPSSTRGYANGLDGFVVSDLDLGIPPSVGRGYDVVLAADVLEHVRHPERLLGECAAVPPRTGVDHRQRAELRPLVSALARGGGRLRLRPARDPRRGTRALLHPSQLRAVGRRRRAGGAPARRHRHADRGARPPRRPARTGRPTIERAQNAAVALRPTLFAYQFVYELAAVTPTDQRPAAIGNEDDEPQARGGARRAGRRGIDPLCVISDAYAASTTKATASTTRPPPRRRASA